ncbi:dimethylsulfoniopropionate demethylase [Cochlodiniinecator piscidefendens]|uniref:dimethylsulfoniopropionate demethylase n=1 Tax=Cochlodiniinecator piscidefendens TaxID=2715756 RepID=UPI001408F770|nr:dimethylsulfoniopropionate demethylase [Cochlodiniinecator piscidefendens]
MALISPSRRLRRTPFSDGVERAGVKAYTVYNRMLLPTMFDSMAADCAHLKSHVQVWDVACERQISVKGPDANRLMALLTPRDLSKMADDQCYYVPMVDQYGGMLNDPVAVKHSDDHYWISIADSDLRLWVKGVVAGFGLDVDVSEPDVSPLAVQGPKADDLMARVFGEDVRSIRFFRYKRLSFQGKTLLVARSGFSKQGGFEIYVDGGEIGMSLWDALFAAGADLNVRAGGPNLIERVESGLLSYGNDMTDQNTPFDCGLGKFVSSNADYIGRSALERVAERGAEFALCPIEILGEPIGVCDRAWPIMGGSSKVGQVTSAVWSPDANCNVAIGMVRTGDAVASSNIEINTHHGPRIGQIRDAFWK